MIRDADHGFGATQNQISVRLKLGGHSFQNMLFRGSVKIDQDISAEYDVEFPESGKTVQKVELPVPHHGPQGGIDLPEASDLFEIFHQQVGSLWPIGYRARGFREPA